MVEVEEEDSRLKRIEREQLEEEERRGTLDKEDIMWRERKAREQQLLDTKRRRFSKDEEDSRLWGARRRPKTLKYARIDENWREGG